MSRRTDRSSSGPGGHVALLALGTFAVGTDAFVVAGFLPVMSAELDVSTATAGQSVTAFAISYAVLAPVLATTTATMPRRRLLTLALCVLAVANLGSALAPTFGVLVVARIAAAAGAAAYTPHAGAVAATLVPDAYRGRALAIVVSGLTIATAVGVPLGTLASRWMGWRTALALIALLCGAVALGLRLLLPWLAGGARMALRTRLGVLGNPAVRTILPVTILGMAAGYTAYAYAVPAFEAVGVEARHSQWLLLLYGLGAVAGARTSGRLTDRYGGVAVLTVGYIVMAGTLVALWGLTRWNTASLAVAAVLSLAWGASTWCQTPPQQHRLIGAAPDGAALVIALNAASIYVGIGLGTIIGGVAGSAHPGWMFLSGALLAVLAGAFLLATTARARGAPASA